MDNNTAVALATTGNSSQTPNGGTSCLFSAETILTACFYTVFSATAISGNLLVIIAVKVNYNLQNENNFLLVNLAVADFLQGAITLPMRLYELLHPFDNLTTVCKLAIPVSTLFGGVSNVTILFISLERFIAVNWPYIYHARVSNNAVVSAAVFCWMSVGILATLPIFGWGSLQPQQASFCRFTLFREQNYLTLLYIFIHVIPVTATVFLYGFILKASCFHARKIHSQEVCTGALASVRRGTVDVTHETTRTPSEIGISSQRQGTSFKRRWFRRGETAKQLKAARTVSVIVGLFIILVVPIIAIDVNEMLGGPRAPLWLVKISVCMIYANHCVNVFAYAGFNEDYRRTFRNIISKCWGFIRGIAGFCGKE